MNLISVIGSGTMGNGIAHTFALAGLRVNLIDISPEKLEQALDTIALNLGRQVSKGSISEAEKNTSLGYIEVFTEMEKGVADADLVIEAATENLAVKLNIFKELDRFCKPEAILASNTSSISITKIAAETNRADKVIGMHFMNPVPVMKLVEVIRGFKSSDDTTKTIMDMAVRIGKIPVEAHDYPGFVANRILMPMINEAIFTLHEGVAGVTEIDTVMKLGMAHPMGPLQLADFIGLDVCLAILNVLQEGFGNPKYAACPLLVNMVTSGQLGVKSGSGFYDYSGENNELVVSKRWTT
ncbi:MAG: 3-hydroxybutyryl-CoA dehydrogenase [Daejeonella sp.]